jgi:hypothetical protein
MNYFIGWYSGSCGGAAGYCTDTDVVEQTTMVPNTGYWSDQDNVYGGNNRGNWINYQNVLAIGTSANSYANYWTEGDVYYPYCLYATYNFNTYNVLAGTNLNSGFSFETWYTLSNGHPQTAWLTIYFSNGSSNTYSAAIPSNPNISASGWEQNLVCNGNGCTTTFSGGSGTIFYSQSSIHISNPQGQHTSENSNCNYGSVSINTYVNVGTQSFSC